MGYAVKTEVMYIPYSTGEVATHVDTLDLQETVPAQLGDISYQQYKAMAIGEAIRIFSGEWVMLPVKDAEDLETIAVPRSDVLSIRARIVKTLDKV